MPRINIELLNNSKEIDEAIFHLNNTMKNTHDQRMSRWCREEIDRMLDAKLLLQGVGE